MLHNSLEALKQKEEQHRTEFNRLRSQRAAIEEQCKQELLKLRVVQAAQYQLALANAAGASKLCLMRNEVRGDDPCPTCGEGPCQQQPTGV